MNGDPPAKKRKASKSPHWRSNKRKVSSPTSADAATASIAKLIAAAAAERRASRQRYLRAIRPARSLGPLERARAWLTYFAEHCSEYGEEEAIVYCKSRSIPCRYDLHSVIDRWSQDAAHESQRAASVTDTLSKANFKEFRVDDSDITWALNNFWPARREQQHSLDATMLRTVEWCNVRGFDQWWLLLARSSEEQALMSGVEPLPGGLWLFNTCRSRLAMSLMPNACARTLRAMEYVAGGGLPQWYVSHAIRREGAIHLGHIACLLFSHARLPHTCTSAAVIEEAVATLLARQRSDGAWAMYDIDEVPKVSVTAMAMTAPGCTDP